MKGAKAWVHKKLKQGVPKKELLYCVGVFSNKEKAKVMKQKNLSSKQYERRHNFLYKAYCYLENL